MSSENKEVWFIFAHQDDECGVFQSIVNALYNNYIVNCIYLSSGTATGKPSAKRNNESISVLSKLGVKIENIYFYGSQANIPDCKIIYSLNRIYDFLYNKFNLNKNITEIYIPAYEGGHPDHDALHIIGLIVGKNLGIKNKIFQYSLYNSYRCIGPFFKVISPLKNNGRIIYQKISVKNRIKFILLYLQYPSQLKTWIGLFPFFLYQHGIKGAHIIQNVCIERINDKPHEGKLYYEKRKFMTWELFNKKKMEFLKNHINKI